MVVACLSVAVLEFELKEEDRITVCHIGFTIKKLCWSGIDSAGNDKVPECCVHLFGAYGCGCLKELEHSSQSCEKQKVCHVHGASEKQPCCHHEEVNWSVGKIGDNSSTTSELWSDNATHCVGPVNICCQVCQSAAYGYPSANGKKANTLLHCASVHDTTDTVLKLTNLSFPATVCEIYYECIALVRSIACLNKGCTSAYQSLACDQTITDAIEQSTAESHLKRVRDGFWPCWGLL